MNRASLHTHHLLLTYLVLMLGLIALGLLFPISFRATFTNPDFYIQAKFIHVVSVTLFFGNAVIGTFWETRSLLIGTPTIVRYTYQTVVWLDAVFTAPLILLSVLSGILLGTTLGGVWSIGWLSIAFVTFLFCGVIWLAFDIPSQYKIKRLFLLLPSDAVDLPDDLKKVLWFRLKLNVFTLVPLLFIFYLMVHKPELKPIGEWFKFVATH